MKLLSGLPLVALLSTSKGVSAFSPTFTSPSTALKAPSSFLARPQAQYNGYTTSSPSKLNMAAEECLLTPEGYGFSSPAKRILKKSYGEGNGFVKVKDSDRVVDVMDIISDGESPDVALVFDDADENKLVGIFTERDYVDFSTKRASSSQTEEESAQFLVSPIGKFVTPAEVIVAVSTEDTANRIIALMKDKGIRHLVVADQINEASKLFKDSKITGVLNMQDVMNVVQKDERLSLISLSKKYPGLTDPVQQMREQMKSDANELANDPEKAKQDIIRTVTAGLAFTATAIFFTGSSFLNTYANAFIIGIFILGYIGIIFEEVFEFDKAAIALLMSTGMWVTYADHFGEAATGSASATVLEQLGEQLSEVSEICFFLLAASTIVEVVDAHQGFKVVTNRITTTSKKSLFWTIGFLTFFLSAILNNLTVTIVMVSLLRKLVPNETDRRLFGAMVVVAANAGGVWTPIGDVTTTMLWINNQLSTIPTITELFLPSVVCLVTSLAFLVNQVEEDSSLENSTLPPPSELAPRGQLVFWSGIASLLAVPVFSEFTGLPPYVAMLTGLGGMWLLTDIIHMGEEEEDGLRVPAALSKLDTSGILFFLGILMSIGVLDKSGLLKQLAVYLSDNLPSLDIIATVIGIASALIDNVPLVAATMGMYDLAEFGTDDKLWQLIALCAGTGGSILIIGSASGVALMGLEKVDFLWYAKNVSVGAAIGYFGGIATYLAQDALLSTLFPPAMAAVEQVQSMGVM